MDFKDIKDTDIWDLYTKSKDFLSMRNIYEESEKFERFYLGDQWYGAKLSKSVEPVCINFIKQIVNQKVSNITENLFAINYSPENIEEEEFIQSAQKACDVLNKKASKVYDLNYMDKKVKKWAFEASIFGEAVCYIDYDKKGKKPIPEDIYNVDIMYGDENNPNIQEQPYILIRQRKNVSSVKLLAEEKGVSSDLIELIRGDDDTVKLADEIDSKLWLITKFWKDKKGIVHFAQATQKVNIVEDEKMGIDLYPIAHVNWTDARNRARGTGEVKFLLPNQIEVNRTEMRRLITVKNTAYSQKVVNIDAIQNPDAIGKVGTTIKFKDMGSTRASDVFMNTTPAQMSTDAEKVLNELINLSKDVSNAGDATTGNIDPSSASGRAILAVQQAQTQPLNDQIISLKTFLEDIARIWFAYWKKDKKNFKIYYTQTNPATGDEEYVKAEVESSVLEKLEASVKVDITPRGAYDKYAQELSLENMMTGGFITFEEYVNALDTDSVMPKTKLEGILKQRQKAQQQINAIQEQANELIGLAQAEHDDAQNINSIMNQGASMYANAVQQAQQQSYGADREQNDVSNNVNLATA